jgi:hypothetical protein
MRRTVLIALAGAAILAVPAAAAQTAPRVTTPATATVQVAPKTGGPRTTFRLTLHNAFTTGPTATLQRSETVDVSGPHRRGCVSSGVLAVPAAPAQQLVRVALSPSRLNATNGATRWCTGTFQGSVMLTTRLLCVPPRLCPMLLIRPQTIARFSYKVTRAR